MIRRGVKVAVDFEFSKLHNYPSQKTWEEICTFGTFIL